MHARLEVCSVLKRRLVCLDPPGFPQELWVAQIEPQHQCHTLALPFTDHPKKVCPTRCPCIACMTKMVEQEEMVCL